MSNVRVYTMSNVNGGDVHIKAGDAGVHGSGGNIEINGGSAGVTIKGGDAISHPNFFPSNQEAMV